MPVLRAAARTLDLLVAVPFGLAYAARYVRPTALTWPLQLLGVALPLLTAALVVVTLLRLRTMRPASRHLHAALVGLAAVRFVPQDLPGGAAPPPDALGLSVVTYNVPRWAGPEGTEKEAALLAYARAAQPDVWAFQEPLVAYRPQRAEGVVVSSFLAALRDSLGYRVGRTAFARTSRTSQPVFTRRVRVVKAEEKRYELTPGAPPMNLTRVEMVAGGRPLVLVNLHLWTTGTRKPWAEEGGLRALDGAAWRDVLRQYRDNHLRRAREADSVRALLDRETLPAVVVGDFNATPHEWAFARVQGDLQDGWREGGRGWGATWHRRAPVARIDHVLADPAFAVVGASLPPLAVSDHKPVAVTLRWR